MVHNAQFTAQRFDHTELPKKRNNKFIYKHSNEQRPNLQVMAHTITCDAREIENFAIVLRLQIETNNITEG